MFSPLQFCKSVTVLDSQTHHIYVYTRGLLCFNFGGQLSPMQLLSPWWNEGENRKGKSEKTCRLR